MKKKFEKKDKSDSIQSNNTNNGSKMFNKWNEFWEEKQDAELIRIFRIIFYSLFTYLSFQSISSTAKYGIEGFNVPQIEILQRILFPTTEIMLTLRIIQFLLSISCLFNVDTLVERTLLTSIFGYCYFISQLDNYQHHYLLFWILLMMNLIDVKKIKSQENQAIKISCWQIKLLTIKLSIVYFWTVMVKLDRSWIFGGYLKDIVSPRFRFYTESFLSKAGFVDSSLFWSFSSFSTILAEIILILGYQTKNQLLKSISFFTSILLHLVFELRFLFFFNLFFFFFFFN